MNTGLTGARRAEPDHRPAAENAPLDWRQLTALPAFREFYRLIRRLFGMNIAIMSPDAKRGGLLGPGRETNPFCRIIQRHPEGKARCETCDTLHALQANRTGQPLRYMCHAGLTEFIIPIVVENEVIALLQCGQVLDRAPTDSDWRKTRSRLSWAPGDLAALAAAFRRTRVLPPAMQTDLVSLLKLIAHHAATAQARRLMLLQNPQDRVVSRALAHLKNHFRDEVTIRSVSSAVGTSRRNLTRLLRAHTGSSLIEHLHRLRIDHACHLLSLPDGKIADIALACGFGSIQQFNRIFRKRMKLTPLEWRRKAWRSL